MLWHRQAIFKSKGDKLCSSAESRIWTRDPRHQFASRLNARWQTNWAIEDQAKNLNSTARRYDQRAFSPLGPTVSWLSQLALAIYIHIWVKLAQVIACYPMAPSHYLNKCWLNITEVLWYSPEGSFTEPAQYFFFACYVSWKLLIILGDSHISQGPMSSAFMYWFPEKI